MRLRPLILLVSLMFATLATGTAAADTSPPTFPILPNQYFTGVVNGKTADATVYTACPAQPPAAPDTRSAARLFPWHPRHPAARPTSASPAASATPLPPHR
jgi:hypothetical protein